MNFLRNITEEYLESDAKVFKTQPRTIGHCPWPRLQMAGNREFKQIATATSTTAVVDAVSWGEYVS